MKRDAPEAVLIEKGLIGVDRRKALARLKAFQLGSNVKRIALWFRCAVAGGATCFKASGGRTYNEYRFDGAPIPARLLRQPVQGLLQPKGFRDKYFGLATIHSLWRNIRRVSVVSGRGRRWRFSVDWDGQETFEAAADPSSETIVRIEWPWMPRSYAEWPEVINSLGLWFCHALDERRMCAGDARRLFQSTPIPVRVEGLFRHWKGVTPAGGIVRRGDARMHFSRSRIPVIGRPRFEVCVLGVTVDEMTGLQAPRTVSGWVDDPGLTLNASLTKVVEDEYYSRLRRAVQEELLRFK